VIDMSLDSMELPPVENVVTAMPDKQTILQAIKDFSNPDNENYADIEDVMTELDVSNENGILVTKFRNETHKYPELEWHREQHTWVRLKKDAKAEPLVKKPEVLDYLHDPDMFQKALDELSKTIEGEQAARHVLWLCAQGRLVKNVEPCSYNMLVSSESGAGKDWVTRHIVNLLPKEYVEYRSRISKKAFTYWHNSKKEPEWTWDGKVCYLEDIANDVLNDDVFKVMASSGSKATIVVEGKAVDLEIKGKPAMFLTSATASPKHELLRRFGVVTLDETQQQTESIMKRKAKEAASGKAIVTKYDSKIVEAQRYLMPVAVQVPFAENFLGIFPAGHLIMRTLFSRFLDWVKASAAFHQYQRGRDENGYVIASGTDYEIARRAIEVITTNRFMLPLTKDDLKILEVAESLPNPFSVDEIAEKVTWISDRTLRRRLDKLATYGLLERGNRKDDYSNRPIIIYTKHKLGNITLPSWDELLTNTTNRQLDNLDKLTNTSNCLIGINDKDVDVKDRRCHYHPDIPAVSSVPDEYKDGSVVWLCEECMKETQKIKEAAHSA